MKAEETIVYQNQPNQILIERQAQISFKDGVQAFYDFLIKNGTCPECGGIGIGTKEMEVQLKEWGITPQENKK